MNFTNNYIKMCEKTVEVQEGWEPTVGDWYLDLSNNLVLYDEHTNLEALDGGDLVFLPLQDQLQRMVKWEYGLRNMFYDLYEFGNDFEYYDNGNDLRYTTAEELTLAFVMKKKHNKVWNGEDWI